MHPTTQHLVLGGGVTPARIAGSNMLGEWDVARADKLTLASGRIAALQDTVAGYTLSQATTGAQPLLGTNAFNGLPEAQFDATDDFLLYVGQPFPAGANASEMWVVSSPNLPGGTPTQTCAFAYGGQSTGPSLRAIRRTTISGVSRCYAVVGDGTTGITASNTSVVYEGPHIAKLAVSANNFSLTVDNASPVVSSTMTPATGALRVCMGALPNSTPVGFWSGGIFGAWVFAPLTPAQDAALTAYFRARYSIWSL